MNKKLFLGVTLLLIIMVFLLTVTVSNETRSLSRFKEYKLTGLPITISLPETTTVKEDIIENKKEVVFNSYLNDTKLNYWGYIQVWNLENLEKFLDSSKATSVYNFTSYSKEKVKINNFQGFLIRWTAVFQNGRIITAQEYFLKKDDSKEVLRISFLVDGEKIDKSLQEIIKQSINSIKW